MVQDPGEETTLVGSSAPESTRKLGDFVRQSPSLITEGSVAAARLARATDS